MLISLYFKELQKSLLYAVLKIGDEVGVSIEIWLFFSFFLEFVLAIEISKDALAKVIVSTEKCIPFLFASQSLILCEAQSCTGKDYKAILLA